MSATDSRLIDCSVFCGHWPFRDLSVRTASALKAHLEERGVRQAWTAPIEAILYPDPMQANEPFLHEVAGDPFFVPVAIVDVTLPTWRRDAQRSLDAGARAFKLTPNYHSYTLADPAADELAQLAMDAGAVVCIQLRVMDERAHHPLMKVPAVPAADVAAFAGRHPLLRVVACGAYYGELRALHAAANVWAELSFVEYARTLHAAAGIIGWERLLFASHSPLHYVEASRIKLDADPDDASPEQVRAVATDNAQALLGSA